MNKKQLYYNTTQFARAMGVDRSTVWRWIKEGKIRVVIVAGKRVIPAEELKPKEVELIKDDK